MNVANAQYLEFGTVPSSLPFGTVSVPSRKTIISRQQQDWNLPVVDSRINGSGCNLYASIASEMTSTSGKVLTDALIYID